MAYVTAVAAKARVVCHPTPAPEYGTDVYLAQVQELPTGRFAATGYILSCQIKSTTTFQISNGSVIYDMEVDAFNKLATWRGGACILILLCLPAEHEDWLHLNESELVMRKCCYWARISGQPSANAASQRIVIPRSQLFTPEAVSDLLSAVERGEL
jgi:hypothetical protein